jgi:DNA-binding response OmpR family regulator
MNLLLIETYEPLTRALRQALEEEGHLVEVAGDVHSGDHKARMLAPDVILINLVRFQADVLALLQRWRQAGLKSRVLALIAPGCGEELIGSPERGADDYLPLPFPLEELLARVLSSRTHARLSPVSLPVL